MVEHIQLVLALEQTGLARTVPPASAHMRILTARRAIN
jgi:hypothetical protein